jgi:MFS family permease
VARDRWNIVCHLFDGVFFFAALITISREMVLPSLIADLSDSTFLVGLITLVVQFGVLLPQVFYAKSVEGLAYKKRAVLVTAILQRVAWIPFLVCLLLWWEARITLPALFAVIACNSIGSGLIVPVWTDWFAKTVPESMWGRLLGLRRLVPAFLGLALGEMIRKIMADYDPPLRYQILVSMGIVFYVLSLLFVALVREERHEGLPHNRDVSWPAYFRNLGRILFRRPDFRTFLAACLLVWLPIVTLMSYLTKYGRTDPGFSEGLTGTWTKYYFLILGVGSILGGFLSDRRGVISPFRMYPLVVTLAAGIAAGSSSPAAVTCAWALTGFALGVQMVVMMPALFRFSGPHRRPSYMAVRFVTLGLAAATIPPLAGLCIDRGYITYRHLFVGCGVATVLSWLAFLRMPAPEPNESVPGLQ